MFEWEDKQDDVDDILAEDINALGHKLIELDAEAENTKKILGKKADLFIVNVKTNGDDYSIDKTYQDILNAIDNNNKIIISVNSNTFLYPTRILKTKNDNNDNELWISAPYEDYGMTIILSETGTIQLEEMRFAREDSVENLWLNVGLLDDLLTYDKSSIVNAINEIVSSGSGGNIVVDQTYNPESPNAQSGKAVAEAVAEVDEKVGDIDTALENIIALQNSYIGGDSV